MTKQEERKRKREQRSRAIRKEKKQSRKAAEKCDLVVAYSSPPLITDTPRRTEATPSGEDKKMRNLIHLVDQKRREIVSRYLAAWSR